MAGPSRLTRTGDIRRALCGARTRGRYVDARVHDRGDADAIRITVTAGRRVGGAVQRNRAKRRIRAALREVPLGTARDVVVIAKPGSDAAPYLELLADLDRALGKGVERTRSDG